jgi:hypothetical protein
MLATCFVSVAWYRADSPVSRCRLRVSTWASASACSATWREFPPYLSSSCVRLTLARLLTSASYSPQSPLFPSPAVRLHVLPRCALPRCRKLQLDHCGLPRGCDLGGRVLPCLGKAKICWAGHERQKDELLIQDWKSVRRRQERSSCQTVAKIQDTICATSVLMFSSSSSLTRNMVKARLLFCFPSFYIGKSTIDQMARCKLPSHGSTD